LTALLGIGQCFLNQNEEYLMKVPHYYTQTTFMFRSKPRSLRKHEEEGKLPIPVP